MITSMKKWKKKLHQKSISTIKILNGRAERENLPLRSSATLRRWRKNF